MDIEQWLQTAGVDITMKNEKVYTITPTDKTPYPEKFYFGFTRDIIGLGSQLKCELGQNNGAQVSFENYEKLQARDKEVVESLRALANN